jgi:hypothetical protein
LNIFEVRLPLSLFNSSMKNPQQTRRILIKDTSKGLEVPQYHGHLVLHGAVTPTAFAERGIKRRSCRHCTELKAEGLWFRAASQRFKESYK